MFVGDNDMTDTIELACKLFQRENYRMIQDNYMAYMDRFSKKSPYSTKNRFTPFYCNLFEFLAFYREDDVMQDLRQKVDKKLKSMRLGWNLLL